MNNSSSSYPTRPFYSGQVDGFRNPMNELKTTTCLEIILNTDEHPFELKEFPTTELCADHIL